MQQFVLGGGTIEIWFSKNEEDGYEPKMSRRDLQKLVKTLMLAVDRGWEIITWNGLGFDFNVLA